MTSIFRNILILVIYCSSIVLSMVDIETNLEQIKDKIKEKIDINLIQSQLPDGIQLPKELLNASLPSLEETTQILKEKCIKVSGSDAAFEEAAQGGQKLNECLMHLINVTALQEEIEKATPIGELDTVFNKYCRKRETAVECVKNFTESIEPCLEQQERENKKIVIDVFTSLVSFACEKDGDNIALFIAEKGPECLKEKQMDLVNCVNTTFNGYLPAETPKTINDLPIFNFGEKECSDIMKLKSCVVTILEECEEPTTANLADALFRFIRSRTPCGNLTTPASAKKASFSPNNANNFQMSGFILFLSVFVTLNLIKF